MLYIRKTQPPQSLLAYVQNEKQRIIDNFDETQRLAKYPEYNFDTNQTTDLRKLLFEEQKGLCCYCMKAIEIANVDNTKNARIEHFLPQSIFEENRADYFNLYLACPNIHQKDDDCLEVSSEQHCDIFKANYIIPKFIGYFHQETRTQKITKCEDFFQFNISGFILPNGSYKTLDDYKNKYAELNLSEKSALITIETLNLNAEVLRKERLNFIQTSVLKKILPATKPELEKEQADYENSFGKEFAGVALYFINERLRRI